MAWWLARNKGKLLILTPKCGSNSLRKLLAKYQVKGKHGITPENYKVAVWIRHPMHRFMSAYNCVQTRNDILRGVGLRRKKFKDDNDNLSCFRKVLKYDTLHNHLAPNIDYLNWKYTVNTDADTKKSIEVGAKDLVFTPDLVLRYDNFKQSVRIMSEYMEVEIPEEIPHLRIGTGSKDIRKQLSKVPELEESLLEIYKHDFIKFGYDW